VSKFECWNLEECLFFIRSGKKKYRQEALSQLLDLDIGEFQNEITHEIEHLLDAGDLEERKLSLKNSLQHGLLSLNIAQLEKLIENEKDFSIKRDASHLLHSITSQRMKKKFSGKKPPRISKDKIIAVDIKEKNIEWTVQQKKALNLLSSFLEQRMERVFVLSGYAGTGKSTLCAEILRRFNDKKFILTASTNKAVSVLSSMNSQLGLLNECITIHKLLNLVPDIKGNGGFLRQKRKPNFNNIDVIVVDECSMINDELMFFIEQSIFQEDLKIIFMGDPMQLPPVNEKISLTFDNNEKVELTQVVRQAADNPIIQLTLKLREMVETSDYSFENALKSVENSDFIVNFETQNAWKKRIQREFLENEPENPCILTWSNRRVAYLNEYVESIISKEKESPYEKYQNILTRKPIFRYFGEKAVECVINTDEICTVITCKYLKINNLSLWHVKIKSLSGNVAEVFHIENKDRFMFEQMNAENQSKVLKINNKKYSLHKILTCSDAIQHLHAMTVHRSQGCTFDKVFVDLPEILNNSNLEESYKMLYVALTRSKSQCYLWQKIT
jgi:exodeoxyribonuclease V